VRRFLRRCVRARLAHRAALGSLLGSVVGWPLLGCVGPRGPALAAPGEVHVDHLARTCARIASCARPHDPPRFRDPSACVEDALGHELKSSAAAGCLSVADSCASVAACFHPVGDARAAAFCLAHAGTKTDCDGDTLITCTTDDPRQSTLTPCSPLGARCGESYSAGGLVAHGCLTPAVCPANVTRVRCDGDTAMAACHDEILERVACQPGETCHPHVDADGEEAATCERAGEVACATIGQRRCRGTVLVDCVPHGHHAAEVSVDCAALGLRCGGAEGRAACVASGASCVAAAPTCDRESVLFCAAGRLERVACSEIGLGPCAPGDGLCAAGTPTTSVSPR
jgi:hypothetical protein